MCGNQISRYFHFIGLVRTRNWILKYLDFPPTTTSPWWAFVSIFQGDKTCHLFALGVNLANGPVLSYCLVADDLLKGPLLKHLKWVVTALQTPNNKTYYDHQHRKKIHHVLGIFLELQLKPEVLHVECSQPWCLKDIFLAQVLTLPTWETLSKLYFFLCNSR